MNHDPKETVMNPIRRIRRITAVLASLAAGLVAFGATPAFAMRVPYPSDGSAPSAQVPAPAPVRIIVAGGMPSWQIALIAAGAALLAAAVAVLAYRAWTTRRKSAPAAA
jgi:hypothetical protein